PEGGSERIRRVINKMVSEEDLIRTVVTAYTNGWRQVKLYFMCGLPTETDDDVVQIARLAHEVIRAGRAATGTRDIRCTVSIGGFVPKPHTPFQWAAQASPETVDRRLKLLKQAINSDRSLGRAIGYRYHDGQPSLVEGLLSRGDRRVGAVIRRVWELGGRFDGWSEHFSFVRWTQACADVGVDLDWYTTRERGQAAALHLPPGLRARVRAGDPPGPGTDRVLPGLHPAPEGLLRQRRADRGGQRGGVPGDRAARPGGPRRGGPGAGRGALARPRRPL